MGEFTFLKEEQIWQGIDQLDVMRKYGSKAAITDFSILLGGICDDTQYINDTTSLKNRTGYYYTSSFGKHDGVSVINNKGEVLRSDGDMNGYGARPVYHNFDIVYHQIVLHELVAIKHANGIKQIEYGEFPQSVVSDEMADKLNEEFRMYVQYMRTNPLPLPNLVKLKETGKVYHFDHNYFPSKNFPATSLEEYEYNGRKYVKVTTNSICNKNYELSNGQKDKAGATYWIEVEPITWLVDEKTKTVITEKIIFAGIPFNENFKALKRRLSSNTIGKYMKNVFTKEITPGNGPYAKRNDDYEDEPIVSNEEVQVEEKKEINNDREVAYSFDYGTVSDEDIIQGAIDSDIAVFLHGKSSDGKSARVKQIDPDCEIVYLRNATPDSLNGKSVYNASKGEMIDVPPTWYKKIKEKCEKEPDRLHIVFFDELTNALPSIQGMAFNIILDKEVNGVWKLPSNCRIVAAGNDLDDSLAANEMAEPLFNRFAHVYIETTIEKWLKWAAKKENNIHPAIFAYVAYKSCSRRDVLRTEYDGKTPNADPRKWEMASKVLYATKNPEMLRSLIGESLTKDFIAFCKSDVITIEDVLSGNYSEDDLKKMNISEKFATAIGLSSCDKKDIEVVKNFVSKLGAEVLATFDVLTTYREENTIKEVKSNNKR